MNRPRHILRLAGAAIVLAASLKLAVAADNIIWTWDDALGSWGNAWGQAVAELDLLEDNTGNGGGSLRISTDYTGNPPNDNRNIINVMGNYGPWLWNGEVRNNLTDYSSVEFDIKWDKLGSTVSLAEFNASGGDNGLVIWSARNAGEWQWVEIARILVPEAAANGWVHVSVPIDPTKPNLDSSAGLMFKKWVPQETSNAGGVAAFWVDNVELVASSAPPGPPTLSIRSDARPGLNLITLAGSEWQRQGIRTVGDNFSWIGSSGPTTYELTVRELPESAYAGFNVYIYLAPRDPRTYVDVDWSLPDIVRFDMSLQGDGTFLGTLRYKTDAPNANGGMYGGAGELGSVSSAVGMGRWGFTFNDDTSITLFSPEATTDVSMPATIAAKFNDALTVYFGSMPNAPERVGQKSVLARAGIQGAAGGVNVMDDFTSPTLNTSIWELAAQNPGGVMILGDDAAFWISWTLPDIGFGLQAASKLNAADWASYTGATAPLPTGPTKSVLISKSGLPDDGVRFWRLRQRAFTRLQILLPGETAAPGTPTGKTGIPDPQMLYAPFEIRINAVADDWSVMSSVTDTIVFDSTDSASALPPEETPLIGSTATLVNGTITLQVDMGTQGRQTITVSDQTNPGITVATSAEVMINQ